MSYARKSRPHRCVRCGHRKTLATLWGAYTRPPKCEACGYYRLYYCRDRMPGKWGRKLKCNCGGYHFMHRRGSKHCEHHPEAERHYVERAEARAA